MFTTERAAAPLLPHLPPRQPGAPGQFAFADRARVTQILADSGWANIDIQPLDVRCTLSEADLMGYISRLLDGDGASAMTHRSIVKHVLTLR